jgi:hypothetical protein
MESLKANPLLEIRSFSTVSLSFEMPPGRE